MAVDVGGWVTDTGGGVVIDAGERWLMCGDHVGVVVDGGGSGGRCG